MSPPAKISITDALLQQTPCTDLSVVAGEAGTPWKLAWSSSTLDRERVHFGQLSLDGTWRELRRWRGIRPRVARCCGRAVVAFIGEREGRSAPALWSHGPQVDVLESNGYCHDIRLVGGDDFGWLALVERRGPRSFIRVGRVDHRVAWAPVAELPGDACALAERGGDVRLAWVDDEGVWVGRLDAGGLGGVVRVADQSGAEAPSLIADEGAWHLAWHAPVGDGVLSWLHVAIGRSDASGESWVVDHPPVDPQWIAAERADAAEDQGWMFPSLAVGPRGLWLAGRSANGFHVQLRAVDGWEPRREVSQPGWGGRSRTCALLAQGGQLYLLRGTPRGLSLGRLSMAAEADGADPAKTPALEPLPVLGASLAGAGRETSASGVGCVLFGDLHQHSVHSDGLASADSVYRRARDLYGHDFTALTDHESFCGKHIGPSTWRYQCELADALYEPGRFVTLKAYEFTAARQPGPGHKCVYFADRVPERLPPKDSDALERLLRDYGAFAVPHHIGWTGADLAHHDPELQPLFEICSVHGAYERAGERRVPPRADVVLPGQFILERRFINVRCTDFIRHHAQLRQQFTPARAARSEDKRHVFGVT